jgi:hypothetical protein
VNEKREKRLYESLSMEYNKNSKEFMECNKNSKEFIECNKNSKVWNIIRIPKSLRSNYILKSLRSKEVWNKYGIRDT